ncbi:MAG: 5' nucleotidase, NT5C type [Cetobacterium sp.]
MKTVVFDIDGVLADFIGGALEVARSLGYRTPHITTLDHQNWDVYPGLDTKGIEEMWEYITKNPVFWERLSPLACSDEFHKIEKLIESGARVYFATNRNKPGALQATRTWLELFLDDRPTNIIITHRKGEFCKVVDADYYIDDKSENVDCAIWMTDKKTKSYVITRPYNSGIYSPHSKSARRVATLAEFLEDIDDGI